MLGVLSTAPLMSGTTAAATQASPTATVTPEQFGAIGDGMADDAPAIQRAMAAIVARGTGGVVLLQPKVAYRCDSGLELDASHVSLFGSALLDFSGWTGVYLRVTASSRARPLTPANNYGRKGSIGGSILLRGAGPASKSIGLHFNSDVIATSARLLVENLSIMECGTGVRFGDRAYNNLLINCEIYNCGLCVDYPEADDNGERNTLIGCTLFNSVCAVRVALPNGALHLVSCSIDYTDVIYDVERGSVLATSCHHESRHWVDRPVRCLGDDALIRLDGGYILNQAKEATVRNFFDVRVGATVLMDGMFVHNIVLKDVDPSRPGSWSTGGGDLRITNSHSFDFGAQPLRLSDSHTSLSDPDFRSATWEDMVWRVRDSVVPIVTRHGDNGDNLRLTKTRLGGETGLAATKAAESGTLSMFVLMAMPVRHDDKVLAGFRVRRALSPADGDVTLFVSPGWIRMEGLDANRIPVVVRQDIVGTQEITVPSDRFLPISPLASRQGRTPPRWATHFVMLVDLVKADRTTFFFNGLWCDTV